MRKNRLNKFNLILITIAIFSMSAISFSMARYQNSLKKQAIASAAKWNFKMYINDDEVTNRENMYEISLADTLENSSELLEGGTIAPGSKGSFNLKLDFSGTETGIKYTYKFVSDKTIPENLKFYTSENYEMEKEILLGIQQLNYVSIDEKDIIQEIPIYWIWEKKDDETTNQNEISNSGKNIVITMEMIAEQYTDEIPKIYTNEKFFDITADGELSLNQENLEEFSTTVRELVIPQKVGNITVESIKPGAFAEQYNIYSVQIFSQIEKISDSCFQNCKNIKKIYIDSFVKNIGKNAFYNCQNLKDITLKNGVEKIDDWAFDNCTAIETIALPESIKYIGESAFYNCTSLKTINLPENLESIGKWAFWQCSSLTSILIPNKVTIIEEGTFGKCFSLEDIKLGTGITKISDSGFYMNIKLTSIVIPESVLEIEQLAFAECITLKDLTILDNVSIEETAFENTLI